MIVGIVGSEAAKFTRLGESRAKDLIWGLLSCSDDIKGAVSGGCHLGGVDIWTEAIASKLGLPMSVFRPNTLSWGTGYRPRNLLIAKHSDEVHCITVDKYPPEYVGMRFIMCYHCHTSSHIKSGGCWTMKQAIKMGKRGQLHVIENF